MGPAWAVALEAASRRSFNGPRPSEAEGRYEEDWCHSMSSWKGAAASRLLAASSYMSVDMHDIIEERPEEDIRHCCLRDALKPDVVGLLEIGVRITPD
eukprot:CAMPEP_0115856208 /NCGR_PEP_ID=MMETSP0287-20121206/14933_1 /TAXON_ID=412157 /ORGANISM="Chrysochromulina rotalis, Strain UIO044" /LENGTH=97 /DNA_ID=CAMNT_0003310373 /DNA_START=277 /DNA_END=570 /DNA_ORIENTATION=-